jgi:hypothetical protein
MLHLAVVSTMYSTGRAATLRSPRRYAQSSRHRLNARIRFYSSGLVAETI